MPNSPVLKRNCVRNSGRAKLVGWVRRRLWLACLCVACLAAGPAQAAVTTDGNVIPSYLDPYPDAWDVGGSLVVAAVYSGSMTINGASDVIDTDSWIGVVAISVAGVPWKSIGTAPCSTPWILF